MALYRCNTNTKSVDQCLQTVCDETDLSLEVIDEQSAGMIHSLTGYQYQCSLSPSTLDPEHVSMLKLQPIRPRTHRYISTILYVLADVTLAVPLIAGGMNKLTIPIYILLVLAAIGCYLGFMTMMRRSHQHIRHELDEIINGMRKHHRVDQISPVVYSQDHPDFPIRLGCFILLLGALIYGCGLTITYFLVPLGVALFTYTLLSYRLQHIWRGMLLTLQMKWTIICLLPVMLVGILIVLTVYRWAEVKPQTQPNYWIPGQFESNLSHLQDSEQMSAMAPNELAQYIVYSEHKLATINAILPEIPAATIKNELINQAILSAGLVLFTLILLVAVGIFTLFTQTDLWRQAARRDNKRKQPEMVFNPDDDLQSKDKLIIAGFALSSAVIQWSAIYIVLEVLSYWCTGHGMLDSLISLGLAYHIETLKFVFGAFPRFASLLVIGTLFIIALPGLLLMFRMMAVIVRAIMNLYTRFKTAELNVLACLPVSQEQVQNWFKEVGLPCPALQAQTNSPQMVSAEKNLLSGNVTLRLSKQCHQLTPLELKVVILHEIAHIKHDLNQLAWLQRLSCFSASPIQFLTILYDFGQRELEADCFAIKQIGSVNPLRSALIKISLINPLKKTSQDTIDQNQNMIVRVLKSLTRRCSTITQPQTILTAAYPTLTERLQHIKQIEDKLDQNSS